MAAVSMAAGKPWLDTRRQDHDASSSPFRYGVFLNEFVMHSTMPVCIPFVLLFRGYHFALNHLFLPVNSYGLSEFTNYLCMASCNAMFCYAAFFQPASFQCGPGPCKSSDDCTEYGQRCGTTMDCGFMLLINALLLSRNVIIATKYAYFRPDDYDRMADDNSSSVKSYQAFMQFFIGHLLLAGWTYPTAGKNHPFLSLFALN